MHAVRAAEGQDGMQGDWTCEAHRAVEFVAAKPHVAQIRSEHAVPLKRPTEERASSAIATVQTEGRENSVHWLALQMEVQGSIESKLVLAQLEGQEDCLFLWAPRAALGTWAAVRAGGMEEEYRPSRGAPRSAEMTRKVFAPWEEMAGVVVE